MAILALRPSNNEVLIGAKCLSCNRPLGGGFPTAPSAKPSDEWYTGAGSLRGPKDRIMEASRRVEWVQGVDTQVKVTTAPD